MDMMASALPVSLEKFIELLHITVGKKKVRYFALAGNRDRDPPVLLFLGADILNNTPVNPRNFCRIHQRYGKEGLASRIEWCDAQVLHIRNSNNLWFYNIQGLFKASFEYQDLKFQKDCLVFLREAWLERIGEPLLKGDLSLTWQETLTHQSVAISFPIKPEDLSAVPASLSPTGESENVKHLADFNYETTQGPPNEITSDIHKDLEQGCVEISDVTMETAHEKDVATSSSLELKSCILSETTTNASAASNEPQFEMSSCIPPNQEKLCETCSSRNFDNTGDRPDWNATSQSEISGHPQTQILSSVQENPLQDREHCCALIENLDSYVKDLIGRFNGLYQELFKNLHLVIQLIFCDLNGILSQSDTFPYSLIEKYLSMHKQKKNSVSDSCPDDFQISFENNIILGLFSEWIGHQNARLNEAINQKAESFKLAHIGCIDDLPSSEAIIDDIFPPHMKALFLQWMSASDTASPHDGMRNSKGVFPSILLILEFANGTFISGMSHVIHARLINAQ